MERALRVADGRRGQSKVFDAVRGRAAPAVRESPVVAEVLQLQRSIGNRAVAAMLRPEAPVHVQRLFGRNMKRRIRANSFPNLKRC